MYSIKDVVKMTGLCDKTIRNYIKAGLLVTAKKFRGVKWYIGKEDIIKLQNGEIYVRENDRAEVCETVQAERLEGDQI